MQSPITGFLPAMRTAGEQSLHGEESAVPGRIWCLDQPGFLDRNLLTAGKQ